LIEKLVTVPSNGTRRYGFATFCGTYVTYVHLIVATQMFALGVPLVLPSVT
jgi:hypothetical protein